MSRSLLRSFVSLSFASPTLTSTPAIVLSSQFSLSSSSSSSSSSFSSHTKPSTVESSSSTPSSNDDLPSDVSTQELKQRIGKYLEGDVDAVPSIFEAILARKLSGKHEDSDDEIMKEFQSKTQLDDGNVPIGSDEDEETDSDDDDLFDSDDELSD